ncbi:hypothetical protein IscW_ISCW004227 [Ixodes scapularis]|uniref:Uncharacterized protein n=1 Tax=Ixodes scapularis TaxID=6945 RepID=B7PJ83_IXOSC|nr:hypothetical protein IscW_ISCW004227 [Ixodes scapularis]
MRPIFLSASSNSRNACSKKKKKKGGGGITKKKVPCIFFFFYIFFCKGVRKYTPRNSNVQSWKSILYVLCTSHRHAKRSFVPSLFETLFFFLVLHLCVSIPIQNSRIMYTLKLRRFFFFPHVPPGVRKGRLVRPFQSTKTGEEAKHEATVNVQGGDQTATTDNSIH